MLKGSDHLEALTSSVASPLWAVVHGHAHEAEMGQSLQRDFIDTIAWHSYLSHLTIATWLQTRPNVALRSPLRTRSNPMCLTPSRLATTSRSASSRRWEVLTRSTW